VARCGGILCKRSADRGGTVGWVVAEINLPEKRLYTRQQRLRMGHWARLERYRTCHKQINGGSVSSPSLLTSVRYIGSCSLLGGPKRTESFCLGVGTGLTVGGTSSPSAARSLWLQNVLHHLVTNRSLPYQTLKSRETRPTRLRGRVSAFEAAGRSFLDAEPAPHRSSLAGLERCFSPLRFYGRFDSLDAISGLWSVIHRHRLSGSAIRWNLSVRFSRAPGHTPCWESWSCWRWSHWSIMHPLYFVGRTTGWDSWALDRKILAAIG